MNNLEVGDKVKFLNTSGGGVVARVIDSRMVSVLIEEGFEIPTMISELIKIEETEPAARFFDPRYNVNLPTETVVEEEPGDDRMQMLPGHLARDRKSEEIFIAFVPHDQKWLITGLIDIYLINNTAYDVLYNIFSKTPNGRYEGMDYGSLFPDAKLLITTINREQLVHWCEGYIQFLFHRQQVTKVLPPFNSEFSIEGKRFFKEGNYRQYPIIQAKGIVVKVLSLTDHFRREEKFQVMDTGNSMQPQTENVSLIMKYKTGPHEAEVDLHIHELVDDPTNMEKGEILEFQKNFFRKCLNSAISSFFMKVIFIHGTGNGVLRNELIAELKNYQSVEFFDAPLAKYGVGALEVRIPHNS
ncbi:MAG: DUF2027 domain-containing protein [Bacteroidales bacterium]|jgi:hypothetical protein|nr:DUF2027 domain-containing protein [Bacteroidales bacterium]